MQQTGLLNSINCPEDLKKIPAIKLNELAVEIRDFLTDIVGKNGGHLASNLGTVELTLALYRVFDFPRDQLVFDVGHQCYTHKLLTGRRDFFKTLRQKGGLSGFPNPKESEYDLFYTGHASTSISTAAGLAAAAKLQKSSKKVVSIIGDGALGGGMCFEAMNHAGHSELDLLVILNDNEMAIGKTVGAVARQLEEFRSRPATSNVRRDITELFSNLPFIGGSLGWLQERILDTLKNHTGAAAIFEAMGFRYFGPFDGHDLNILEHELNNLKQLEGPRILHVVTEKGRGFPAAVADPEKFHSAAPFVIRGSGEVVPRTKGNKSYSDIFCNSMCKLAKDNPNLIAITAAMTAGTGMKDFADEFPDRLFDVGMAESHAIPFAAGLAKAGHLPVVAIYSTFLQRGYDQIFHDISLQAELPVIFALDRAGLVGNDGPTHHGVFDIAYLRHFPNLVLLSPRDGEELEAMLKFAVTLKKPCAIRYPRGGPPVNTLPEKHTSIALGKSEKIRDGKDGAVFAYGRLVEPSLKAANMAAQQGADLAVYNARFAKPLDNEAILDEATKTGNIITTEDHVLAGGFGSAVSELLSDSRIYSSLTRIGIPDRFIEAGSVTELDALLGFDAEGLCKSFINSTVKKTEDK